MNSILKKIKTTIIVLAITASANSQTVSTFENFNLLPDSFIDGRLINPGNSISFQSGNASFSNFYDSSFGGFWGSGFAISSMRDTVSSSFVNQYSSANGSGHNSISYTVFQREGTVKLISNASGKQIKGFYINNSTYSYLSMKNGDAFAKKFGGLSGNDPDWFLLTIKGWKSGATLSDSVNFYLADLRNTDNSKDYILKNWTWVNLLNLGNVDSISFVLSSSDNGTFGMNTPAYFCIDNFTTQDIGVAVKTVLNNSDVRIYPNPVSDFLSIETEKINPVSIEVYDVCGNKIMDVISSNKIDVSMLKSGIYFLRINGLENLIVSKFIKE